MVIGEYFPKTLPPPPTRYANIMVMVDMGNEFIGLKQRFRIMQVGFVGLLVIVVGFMCLSLFKPVESATSPGTCLPVDKGGTGCDTLPVSLGGTGGTTPLDARAGLGFASLGLAQTINTNMAGLQAAIDSLPKFLANDVTINVTAGEIAGDIIVERFNGPGRLVILAIDGGGLDVVAGVQTHKLGRMVIQNNSVAYMRVSGMTATSANNSGFLTQNNSSGMIDLTNLNAVEGSSATSANVGVMVNASGNLVIVHNCTFSNKYYAIHARIGRVAVSSAHGTGNANIYRSEERATMNIGSLGDITGATTYSRAAGGVIFDPNGNQRGNAQEGQNFTANGATISIVRKGTMVTVSSNGTFASATTAGQLLFTTPVNLRPNGNIPFFMTAVGGVLIRFQWNADGNFYVHDIVPSGTILWGAVTFMAND